MIAIRGYRPVYGTAGTFDTFGYGADAYRDRGQSMASPSDDQTQRLERLARTPGEATPRPNTVQEATAEIDRLTHSPLAPSRPRSTDTSVRPARPPT